MRRWVSPFLLVLVGLLGLGYAYTAWRLTATPLSRGVLALPFLLVLSVPLVYWVGGRQRHRRADDWLHAAAYLAMAWLNFLVLLTLGRDLILLLLAPWPAAQPLRALLTPGAVLVTALLALGLGMLAAWGGPRVRRVQIPIEGLDPALEGYRILQISDLHVGPTLGRRYVRRVVRLALAQQADVIALTGDIVDGSVARLAPAVAPLAALARERPAVLVMGNHEYYAGADAWVAQFRQMGLRVLLNEHMLLQHRGVPLVLGGVVDPAVRQSQPQESPRPDLASAPQAGPALRVLLAHHPGLAPAAEQAGFDLQLSGHTHAGQFFPWTLAVRLVHGPHVAGLSRCGRMWVYVSPGTGSWGPPVRLGTRTEIGVIELRRG